MISNEKTKISNVPEFTVSELAGSLKRTLEETYGRVRVRGELSRVSIAASGHMYSSLKDENAVLDAVCWKGMLGRLSVSPEEGLEVVCTGRVSSYPRSSKYQLIIESMELAGEGALLKMLEARKKKLAAEGLFDPSRKKTLPFLPELIGVVTSPTGAVIRDILHRLGDRFPRHVLVWPVLVQGDGAEEQVVRAIEGFDALPGSGTVPRPDLLIIARGGGSLEDLMPFNEENVVRAAAACSIPVISAIGHETDTTLLDYAADLRAPTPTGAAEIAVPRRADLRAQLYESHGRLVQAMTRQITELTARQEALQARLGDPSRLLELRVQRLDYLSTKINGIFTQFLHRKERALQICASDLPHPRYIIRQAETELKNTLRHYKNAGKQIFKDYENRFESASRMLESLSFKKVLERGFVVVKDAQGKLMTEAGMLKAGQNVSLCFKNDQTVGAIIEKAGKKTRKKGKKTEDMQQKSLF